MNGKKKEITQCMNKQRAYNDCLLDCLNEREYICLKNLTRKKANVFRYDINFIGFLETKFNSIFNEE